jgi:molecular chaperone HtpG
LNQLAPTARDIARRCRQSSISRKWQREFDVHKEVALERAKTVARGGLTRAARQTQVDAALKSLKAMKKVVENRHLDEEVQKLLSNKADTAEARVQRLLGDGATSSDPLAALPSPKKTAYQHIISLIYECSANRIAAGALVERLLVRLSDETTQTVKLKTANRRTKNAIDKKTRGKK